MYLKNFNAISHGGSGNFNDQVVLKQVNGKTIVVAKTQKKATTKTEGQQEVVDKFKAAAKYARSVTITREKHAPYKEALGPAVNLRKAAMKDFLTPPEIYLLENLSYTGAPGGQFMIDAKDDVKVTVVEVQLFSDVGNLLESGAALQDAEGGWRYTTTVNNAQLTGTRVVVMAADLAGNIAGGELTL